MKKIHNFLKLSQISLSPYIWAIKKKKLHGESCMSYFIYFLFYERIVMCEFGKLWICCIPNLIEKASTCYKRNKVYFFPFVFTKKQNKIWML